MLVNAKKESRTLGKKKIGLTYEYSLWKICRLSYGFCFFVISTSGPCVISSCLPKYKVNKFSVSGPSNEIKRQGTTTARR
jgi:hypothetical protein